MLSLCLAVFLHCVRVKHRSMAHLRPLPVLAETVQMPLLVALCRISDGLANVRAVVERKRERERKRKRNQDRDRDAAACMRAFLKDTAHVAVMGGQPDKPRSLGSVHAAAVLRFMGGTARAKPGAVMYYRNRNVVNPCPISKCSGMAITRDGMILLSCTFQNKINVYRAPDGAFVRAIGGDGDGFHGRGTGPLQFAHPMQIFVAADGDVFIAEAWNKRVQVLTPALDFRRFVSSEEHTKNPMGVCANADTVFVGDYNQNAVVLFRRSDGAYLRAVGRGWSRWGLCAPTGLTLMHDGRRVLVLQAQQETAYILSECGEFQQEIRLRSGGHLSSAAFSDAGELVSASCEYISHVVVHKEHGDGEDESFRARANRDMRFMNPYLSDGAFTAVAVHKNVVYAVKFTEKPLFSGAYRCKIIAID